MTATLRCREPTYAGQDRAAGPRSSSVTTTYVAVRIALMIAELTPGLRQVIKMTNHRLAGTLTD